MLNNLHDCTDCKSGGPGGHCIPIYKRRPEEKRSVRTRLTPSQGPQAGFSHLSKSCPIIYQLVLRAEGGCRSYGQLRASSVSVGMRTPLVRTLGCRLVGRWT